MQNTKAEEKQKSLAYAAVAFAVSALLNGAQILTFPTPLCISLCAVCSPIFSVFLLLSTVISTFLYGNFALRFYILFSLGVCCIIRTILFSAKKESNFNLAASAFISCLAGMCVLFLSKPSENYSILTHLVCSVICGVAAFCFKSAYDSFVQKKYISLCRSDGVYIGASFVFVVSVLASVNASAVNIGIIATMIISLYIGRILSQSAGCVCAALGTLGVSLCSANAGRLCVLLPVFVLISSHLPQRDKRLGAACFVLTNLIFCILTNLSVDSLIYLLNVILSAVVFCIYKNQQFASLFRALPHKAQHRELLLENRMRFAASALKELRKDTVYISQILQRKDKLPSTPNHIAAKFCKQCENRKNCWEDRETEAYAAFGCFIPNAAISSSTLPTYFDDCPNRLEIAKEYGFFEQEKALEKANDNLRKEIQSAVFSLLEAQAQTFVQSSEYICKSENSDYDLSAKAHYALQRFGVKESYACVFGESTENLKVEIYLKGVDLPEVDDIVKAVSNAIDCDMQASSIMRTSDSSKLTLISTQGQTNIDLAFAQSSAEEDMCGDHCLIYSDGFGNQYMALSDGMGHGRDAALNARFCLSLLKKLTCSGIPAYAASMLINSAMMIKDNADSFATLDVTKINTNSGETELLKSGASATLLCSQNRVICIKAASFPLGIVGTAEPYKKVMNLKSGDRFVVLSDGVEEEYYQYIKSLLLHKKDFNAKQLADEICQTVSDSYRTGKKDDISVCVGIIE